MTGAQSVLLAMCAGWLLAARGSRSLSRLGSGLGATPQEKAGAAFASGKRRALTLLAGLLVVLWVMGGGGGLVAVGVASWVGLVLVRRLVDGWRGRRSRRVRQRLVIAVCDGLSAELRGGLPASTAVRRACADEADLSPVVAAALLGGDVAGAFKTCADLPGAEGLHAVAAAWEVAGSSGAALAGVLERVGHGLRSDDEARSEVRAALGPPRATAKMLAVLPLFGLALGGSIGADPVHFLLATPWGLGCLACGVVLALLGVWWVDRLASAAEF